jgi:hypothetical protein
MGNPAKILGKDNLMDKKYKELEKLLRQIAKAHADNTAAIAQLEASAKDYAPEYIKNFVTPKIEEANAGMVALKQAGIEKVYGLLDDLKKLTDAKHEKLNLANPAWTNALKLIELGGKELSTDTILKINAQFSNDQSALRALRDVYKAKGVIYDGGLDKQIYEPEGTFKYLQEWAYNVFMRNGSLNEFAREISQVAVKEGIAFPVQVDDVGANNVLRQSAGLPEKVVQ